MTRKEEISKKGNIISDKSVRGVLVLGEKLWFNDDLRCRLRICGWSKEQQEELRRSRFVDLTIINPKNVGEEIDEEVGKDDSIANVIIHISQFGDKDISNVDIYSDEEKNKIREKEKELVNRINRLDKKGMRAALYSINDMALLDEIVTIGENLEMATNKIGDGAINILEELENNEIKERKDSTNR